MYLKKNIKNVKSLKNKNYIHFFDFCFFKKCNKNVIYFFAISIEFSKFYCYNLSCKNSLST